MTNKPQSVINRKRLDQKVVELEEHCLKLFKEIAWARDQDRHDFERLVEIMAGLDRVEVLQTKLKLAKFQAEHDEHSLAVAVGLAKPEPIWKRFLWRKT